MSWIPDRYRELRDVVKRPDVAKEVREEFEAHLAMRTDELISSGVSPSVARSEALRRFGDVESYQFATREIDARSRRRADRSESFRAVAREISLALRALQRSPGFATVTALTLSLGIGATIAIFTLLVSIVLHPLPFPSSERIVRIAHPVPGVGANQRWGLSVAGYHDMLKSPALRALGVYSVAQGAVFREGNAERVTATVSSATLFDVLGVHARLGRLFRVDETRPGAAPVALLSHAYWMREFGGDPSVLGTSIEFEGVRHEIIGVLPPEAQLPGQASDLWLALELDPTAPAQNSHYLTALGRLRDGVTPLDATRMLLADVGRFPERYPNAYSERFFKSTGFTVDVVSWRDEVVGDIGRALWILFGSVGLVLLIACANVVNLVLVRAESRSREVAVRRALGAEGRHLAWHFIAEGLIVATGAGLVGIALAWGALRIVVANAPNALPRVAEVNLGIESVVFAAGLVLLAALTFGLVPLWHEEGNVAALREGGRSGSAVGPSRRRTRNALVLAQVALSVILLASAGLLLRSAAALRHIELGFQPERTLTFALSIPWERYRGHRAVTEFHRELTSRLAAIPGVSRASVGSITPLSGYEGCSIVWVEGRPTPPGEEPPCVGNGQVSPGYFESLGIPVRGRTRTWDDETAVTDGVVVTAALARRLWPGEDAIGKGIKGNGGTPPYYHVIGVSGDFRATTLDAPPVEAIFFPLMPIEGAPLWSGARDVTVIIKSTSMSPRALLPAVRKTLQTLDPRIPVANVSTMDEVVDHASARTRFVMLLLSLAAAMALILSAVGMHGVISHLVGQRRNEIGVRMALGARSSDVRAMVVRESLALALGGVAVGVAGALMATRLLGAMLYGVSPNDPLTLSAVSATLLAVATAASYIPARRASRIDPSEALRGS